MPVNLLPNPFNISHIPISLFFQHNWAPSTGWIKEKCPEDDLHTAVEYYGEDLSKGRLMAQIMSLENVPLTEDNGQTEETKLRRGILQVCLANLVYNTLFLKSWNCLHCIFFAPPPLRRQKDHLGQLCRLKTCLRSTMSRELLSYYMFLAMYPEKLDGRPTWDISLTISKKWHPSKQIQDHKLQWMDRLCRLKFGSSRYVVVLRSLQRQQFLFKIRCRMSVNNVFRKFLP